MPSISCKIYGYIEEMKWLKDYLDGKPTVEYTRIAKDGSLKVERIPETEYIRHQIHHPENTHNPRFTDEQLRGSIETMRAFIIAKGPAAPQFFLAPLLLSGNATDHCRTIFLYSMCSRHLSNI